MKINELHLNNWMIFKGSQKVVFASNAENITIIFGENMHGKTSLLNSIRWCLYGAAKNRQGSDIPNSDLLNESAKREGIYDLSVKLNLTVDEDIYEIKRDLNAEDGKNIISKVLKVNGRLVNSGQVDSIVERILPQQISQFMLFDGEVLKTFENLVVAQGSTQATGIKNSIEESLGIPLLRRVFEGSEIIVKDLKAESKKELQSDAQAKMVSSKIAELETKRQTHLDEVEEISVTLEEFKSELSDLSNLLHETEDAIKLIERRKNLEDSVRNKKEKASEIDTELKLISSNLWFVPLAKALKSKMDVYEGQLDAAKDTASQQISKTMELVKIQRSLEHRSCPTCSSKLSDEKINEMIGLRDELEDAIESFGNVEEIKYELQSKIKQLKIVGSETDQTEKYKLFLQQHQENDREILELENDIYEIQQLLKGVDEQTSIITRNKYDAINKEIAVLENGLLSLNNSVDDCENQIQAIRKSKAFVEISKNSTLLQKVEKAERLRDILKKSITLYRDSMREEVEKRATETFSKLTTEKKFDRLEINDSYGLKLIIDGVSVNRSAGAEQIVAMSLIEAINYHGRRTGPMIMDTPVGRLDNKHREKIINYLPKVVTQLAIFAHSGEFEEDNNLIDPKLVGARYRLQRISTFETEIVGF
ncbi:AAA family ATPase [Alphaproteobacteria bacterium]|nr:AAA family ATPase [Alphaproteobacteria bacterium]